MITKSIKIVLLIFYFGLFDLYADSTIDYKPIFLNYGFGNFGPNHQISSDIASYKEIQIKYYSTFSKSFNSILDFGVIFNTEKGYGSCDGPVENEYEVTSILYYLSFLFESNFEYFGFSLGGLISGRTKGFCDEGPDALLWPLVGVKIGKIDKIYIFGELTNDLIYSHVWEKRPILFGLSYSFEGFISSLDVGYFKSETQEGYNIRSKFSAYKRLLIYGQAVYRPTPQIYSFRIGIGYKI